MLLSLFLQVFLFLTASLRRRKTSPILRTALWLVYLSADTVAIFVLGHLAVHARKPRNHLMPFWVPFVLVHLGGQDTITAFSKQDNELWRRHLLSLLTQVTIAGYIVGNASWPDRLLRSDIVLMFLSGCLKYAERTLCLYLSNPAYLRSDFLEDLSETLEALQGREMSHGDIKPTKYKSMFNLISEGNIHKKEIKNVVCVDAPPNKELTILAVDNLPTLLKEFWSSAGRYGVYESVGSHLVNAYSTLYTKYVLREGFYKIYTEILTAEFKIKFGSAFAFLVLSPFMLYPFFQFVSTPVTLVVFTIAEKGDQLHTSRADIIVSYILLVGAIALDVSSATMFFLSKYFPSAAWSRKQWSEELGQYNIIKRHVVQVTTSVLSSVRQWIGRRLGGWGVDLLELTHTPIIEPVKEIILDNLLLHGTRKEWHVASSRGLLAVQNWKHHREDPTSKSTAEALEKTISGVADFPRSVLIWHLATDICYYYSGDAASTRNRNHSNDQVKKEDSTKEVSRQLSNYIMYLVFKCGVKLTTNSQHLHDKAHEEIRDTLSGPQNHQQRLGEKEAFMKIFEANKKDGEKEQKYDSTSHGTTTQQKHEEQAAPRDDTAGDNHVKKLLQSAQTFDSPVLPRACELAQMLISINEGEADRWGIIAAVWSELLYYAAPRCGGAFHYEHLSTGGEFATHVLVLMRELGPFMPPPDDPA